MEQNRDVQDLVAVIKQLRGENGCPWDKVQTHESLREAMIEESYEVVDAINKKDMANLKEELGDVLLQVVFHSQLAEEVGTFTLEDVVEGICNKMIYRHPHVFGTVNVDTADEVLMNWESLKKKEKKIATQTQVMRGVPNALPALTRAQKVKKKAADVGFDFGTPEEIWAKVLEEMGEFQEAVDKNMYTKEEEFGDILFAMVNIARVYKINPEFALTKATEKFINRFERIEEGLLFEGKQFTDCTKEDLYSRWDKAKQ
ncbi:nucleoside triphosphate pyrophosphohydrolase [Chakrabartyella piscis]|uniref:nucleoside triphosphate pyrophosphohydrolase n=1 Tax=Chakrabartyella piscis TaxID=2918914 RepID=UPI0029588ECF|nr:nucleoside triphosphate pyrophosphohydrolase [Chakrabartyella piscis]